MAASSAGAQPAEEILAKNWEEIEADARGGEVNWYLWGGSDRINAYVSEKIGGIAQQRYNIKLNRVGINDTAEAVNTVISEYEAGLHDDGSVDMIWINGENFRTLRQADLVFCGYLDKLPNNRYIDWSDPAIEYDFGTPVEGCETPWNRVQFVFARDTARTPEQPATMAQLLEWIKKNPGRFTYPAPPDFTGSVFVRHVFYHAAGGHEALLGEFNQEKYDEAAKKTWQILADLEPYLWRKGATYPKDLSALEQLFANQEVDLFFSYSAGGIGAAVADGVFPETTTTFGLESGTIGNTNYVTIPRNSPNKAAAMVLANILISPEAQLLKADPEVWGQTSVLSFDRLSTNERAAFEAVPRHPSVISSDELAKSALPELQADWLKAIEQGWKENLGR